MNLVFKCRADNDLYHALVAQGRVYPRFATLAEAVEQAPPGAGVLALADPYPHPCLEVELPLLQQAVAKDLWLYLEYPAKIAGLEGSAETFVAGEPQTVEFERAVVCSDFFAPELEPGHVLDLHRCWFLSLPPGETHLVLAKVAGYDTAAFGLPQTTFPLLVGYPDYHLLVAASKLSGFITGRYGPTDFWQGLWQRLLQWLARSEKAPALTWTPTVGLTAGPEQELPAEAESQVFRRSVRWFRENVLFKLGEWEGVLEGFESAIDCRGRQYPRPLRRADCNGEAALVFAYDWALTGDPQSRVTATHILNYVWDGCTHWIAEAASPAYGLLKWFPENPAFYGDDNARVILPTLAAARLLEDDRWNERVLRCLIANLRTTGPQGFRRNCIDLPDLAQRGWQPYREEEFLCYAPHFQAYLWAGFLWAYALTGYSGFLTGTRNAIAMTMAVYPKWHWTNGLSQELARMLLPLTFLVRIQDTAEHRGWLRQVAEELLADQQPCGAIQERLGDIEEGQYPPPQSNDDYGTNEASLIQQTGDPACDLLYTANFAYLGLHEAAAATGENWLREAEDRLAEFFCRIQVRSPAQPYLEGGWMRSFDFRRWEYWGSSSDASWGPWCVESGWTNAWIAAVTAMRRRGETLFDLSLKPRLQALIPALVEEMLE